MWTVRIIPKNSKVNTRPGLTAGLFFMMIHKKFADIKAFVAGDDTHLKELLHPKNDPVDLPYSLALAKLDPGCASHAHILKESDELYVFQEGRGEVILNGAVIKVEANQLFLVPAGQEQYVRNTGDMPLVFYCIVTPPWAAAQEVVQVDDGSK